MQQTLNKKKDDDKEPMTKYLKADSIKSKFFLKQPIKAYAHKL